MLALANKRQIPLLQNRRILRQNYATNAKEYLFLSSIIFIQLEFEFTQLHLLKFLCKFDRFPTRYRRKQKWVFLLKHSV